MKIKYGFFRTIETFKFLIIRDFQHDKKHNLNLCRNYQALENGKF